MTEPETETLCDRDCVTEAETERTTAVDYEPVILSLLEEWHTLPPSQRREMLARLIRHIEGRARRRASW